MSNEKPPRVSIGLPVFNGENFIAQAIASILAQTFTDFELIISDNASTDGTAAICRAYAARDHRIRYYRNDRNLGAAANFNRVFELASGEYFKWAAHDDMLAPTYLEKCVAALDEHPNAVLCHAFAQVIGAAGEFLEILEIPATSAASPRPSERFAASILAFHLNEFGVIRTDALRGTPLIAPYGGSDRVLLGEVALKGPFICIPEPLFFHRDHPARFVNVGLRTPDECLAWLAPDGSRIRAWHAWTTYSELFRIVPRRVEDRQERLRCYAHLLRWLSVNSNLRHVIHDVLWVVNPRIVTALRAFKRSQRARRSTAPWPQASDGRVVD